MESVEKPSRDQINTPRRGIEPANLLACHCFVHNAVIEPMPNEGQGLGIRDYNN